MIKINPQDLHWQNAQAGELILGGGSKAGVYRFLSEHPKLREHLPEGTQIMNPGEDPEKFAREIRFGERKKIVRGFSDIKDFIGMVDVLRSIPKVDRDTLSGNVNIVLKQAKSGDVMSFEEYEFGPGTYDGNIGVMVQDFYGSGNPYSIVKNPHLRDSYIIEQIRGERRGNQLTEQAVYDFDNKRPKINSSFSRIGDHNEELEKAMIDFFKEVMDSGIAPEDFTIMMELGLDAKSDKFIIYQIKLFRKIEPASDFYVPGLHSMEPWQSFGKTSEEGIELKSDTLNEAFIGQYKDEGNMCYVNKSTFYESAPLNVQPRNIYALISFDEGILVHGAYRWAMKANVFMKMLSTEIAHLWALQRLKIYSNGFDGGVALLDK